MTNLPVGRKMSRDSRKISELSYEPSSPAKTYTHSKPNLSQSYKIEGTKVRLDEALKKEQKNGENLIRADHKKKIGILEKDSLSEVNIKLNQTMSLPLTISTPFPPVEVSIPSSHPLTNSFTKELLEEIFSLKSQIVKYKESLLLMRTKYLELQEKCCKQAESDHLLDILKMEIDDLKERNQILNEVVLQQNRKIVGFEIEVIEITQKLSEHYANLNSEKRKLEVENSVFHELFFMKAPKIMLGNEKVNNKITEENKDKTNSNENCESESESSNEEMYFSKENFCKNEEEMRNKYANKQLEL